MSSNMEDRVIRLREERIAREQARIQKLRELNMKKYPKSELPNPVTNQPVLEKKTSSASQVKTGATTKNYQAGSSIQTKSGDHIGMKRPITVPVTIKTDYTKIKPKVITKFAAKNDPKVEGKGSIRDMTVKRKDVTDAGRIPQRSAAVVTKSIANKPSTCNFDMISKPDIIITENSDNEAEASNAQNSDTTTSNKTALNGDGQSKPDILITIHNDNQANPQLANNKPAKDMKVLKEITKKVTINSKLFPKNDIKSRKSCAPVSVSSGLNMSKNIRKSMLPKLIEGTKSESVFDRLYKPKFVKKPTTSMSDAEKMRTDPNYLKKVVKNADLIFKHNKTEGKYHQRRSISAVHFKRISKSEVGNCIHKWGSIGDNLNSVHMNEDVGIKDDKVTSAIKSERKKVQFLTPGLSSFNTPRPDELQARLKLWLQKRGKSLSSYHHLQCFGLHNMSTDLGTPKSVSSIPFEDAIQSPKFDEENKENIALDSDSDDGSYAEIMNEPKEASGSVKKIDVTNWRNASIASESVYNESNASHKFEDVTLTPAGLGANVDDLLYGVLNDLSALLREGFDWQQAARWLRSIRGRFPDAPRTAAYWECRAALEDARGNLTASLECWNEAIAKGTEESVVDSNLDQLLNKFMQLKISPQSGAVRQADPKLVDVKNVFKSTIIKFAVQQAKLRNQSDSPTPTSVFTVTPVRRSARLSHRISRTPLRLCDTVRQAATIAPEHVFTHNDNFVHTP